ncbi:YceD family protein [Undibacterium arcticum]|uniref:Large ribosomal RNA subunit accumulation protein YceD n=1 Tax=Undibacterium arcticum TaxID=1762892 RepID=A0ABV7FCI5_9BURK
MNPVVIDSLEFCRVNERREGRIAVADLPRLGADCVDSSGELAWSLQGGTGRLDFAQLTLAVSGTVQLMCQRCLTPFAHEIAAESVLMLAKDEERADEMDELLDDDTIDVIVASKTLNVPDLVEDEALLALPFSPKHEVCPDVTRLEVLKSKKESPFAALKGLKQ